MRNVKWLIAAALVIPATGCVQSMDQGYGYSNGYYSNGYASSGYASSGYYGSPGYYATPRVNNYYYTPAPKVVTQTRYVPVPTPVPVPTRHADRWNDRRWDDNNKHQPQPPQHVDRPHNPPPQVNNNGGNNNRHNGNWRDRNSDGQPDHRS